MNMDRQDVRVKDAKGFASSVKKKARQLGADLANTATVERWTCSTEVDATQVRVYPHSGYLPNELMPSARSFIMVAVRLLDGVLDHTTTDCKTTGVQGNFAYIHLNRRLHSITYELARWLEDEKGYRSLPLGYNIGARYDHNADDDDTIVGPAYGVFNMKRAAVLAGLGRQARNGLVASPEFGTSIRLGCVITAAPLASDPLLAGESCPGGCNICSKVCPTDAISREGKVDHLRCYSDVGRSGTHYVELKAEFKKRYPPDLPGTNYIENDYLSADGMGNRLCKIACVALCPLGERSMPDVHRRVKDFDAVVAHVALNGFPPGR